MEQTIGMCCHGKCQGITEGKPNFNNNTLTCTDCGHVDTIEEPSERFIVMCRVSGGITGTRQSQLKKNGEPAFFTTRGEAQEEADRLNKTMNNQYSRADFSYWVEGN